MLSDGIVLQGMTEEEFYALPQYYSHDKICEIGQDLRRRFLSGTGLDDELVEIATKMKVVGCSQDEVERELWDVR
jgi:hypothetical protein